MMPRISVACVVVAQALMAAAAAIPASGAVSAQEAAFNAFTGPQAYITQVQDPGPAETVAPTPGQLGAACVSMASANHATGALILLRPEASHVQPVSTDEIGALPTVPEGIDCPTPDEFEAQVKERLGHFVNDVADYIQDTGMQVGAISSAIRVLRDESILDNPRLAWVTAARSFDSIHNFIGRNFGQEVLDRVVDQDRFDALMERAPQMSAEVQMLEQLQEVKERVQTGLDSGEIDPANTRPVIVPDGDAVPIRFESGPQSPHAVQQREASARIETPTMSPQHDHRRRLTA